MLADQQAETVAEARLTVLVAVVPVRGRRVLIRSVRAGRPRRPTEFLDRAEADAVGLAEGAVDGAGLGDAHLGAVDQGRDVGGIGVAVADEAFRTARFVNGRLEDPAAKGRITIVTYRLNVDSQAFAALCQADEPCMCYIPLPIEEEYVTKSESKAVVAGETPQGR